MWEQRIILGWFKDNDKLNKTVTAEDINTVGKEVRSAIDKIDVVAKDVFDGNTDENQNTNTSSNGKSRDFAFVYPESNYSGGVIPYDLDNNPNVEFISTQADNVNRSSASTEQSGNTKTDSTTDSTSTTNEESSSNADTTGNTDRDVTTTFTYTGTDISTLADQILAQLPATDFFRQFAEKLQGCFQRVYLVDEQLEEEGENYYV